MIENDLERGYSIPRVGLDGGTDEFCYPFQTKEREELSPWRWPESKAYFATVFVAISFASLQSILWCESCCDRFFQELESPCRSYSPMT